jgi:hypothetical protein
MTTKLIAFALTTSIVGAATLAANAASAHGFDRSFHGAAAAASSSNVAAYSGTVSSGWARSTAPSSQRGARYDRDQGHWYDHHDGRWYNHHRLFGWYQYRKPVLPQVPVLGPQVPPPTTMNPPTVGPGPAIPPPPSMMPPTTMTPPAPAPAPAFAPMPSFLPPGITTFGPAPVIPPMLPPRAPGAGSAL